MTPTIWIAFGLICAQPGDDVPKVEEKRETQPLGKNEDEDLLLRAGVKFDAPSLLKFFRGRTMSDQERAKVAGLIKSLNSDSYRIRNQALHDLISRGPVVLEQLREQQKSKDLELARRVDLAIAKIAEKDVGPETQSAAVRVLGQQAPPETIEVLLAFLPFADNDNTLEEIRAVFGKLAVKEGKADPTLVAALKDPTPERRAAAAEALARSGPAEFRQTIRDFLKDPEPFVRWRVALALVQLREKDAVLPLIDVTSQLPLNQAWQAEDLLLRVGEGKTPPVVSQDKTAESRQKFRDAWKAWWQKNQNGIDLARLDEKAQLLNYTLVVLLDQNVIQEVDADNKVLWSLDKAVFPLDVQSLAGDRILIAEYHGQRVSERSTKTGEVLWTCNAPNPLVAQRLANGNTFIITDEDFREVDREQKTVMSHPFNAVFNEGERVMKGMKLPNGDMVALTTESRIIRLSPTGVEIKSFPVQLTTRLFGGRIHALPNGRVLVPQNFENQVVEYDGQGKVVWQTDFEKPVAATRLPNGNTLITSMDPNVGAVEVTRTGERVWSFKSTSRVTRALRR